MTIPVIICDDSSFARKQVARALPKGWDVDISFAANGFEGLELIRAGKGDIIFLDLQMPNLDGFQVLQQIRDEDLQTLPIVISGDIQPESRKRVMLLGAVTFISKPVDAVALSAILDDYGVLELLTTKVQLIDEHIDFRDWCQEMANVAMGRAADLLVQFIDEDIQLSIPKVELLNRAGLEKTIAASDSRAVSHVSRGFIGSKIQGETLVIFHDIDFNDLARLMRANSSNEPNRSEELELLLDISNILMNSFMQGFADLINVSFSQGHPRTRLHCSNETSILQRPLRVDEQFLTIKINYAIGDQKLQCDQLVLFPQDSIESLKRRSHYSREANHVESR